MQRPRMSVYWTPEVQQQTLRKYLRCAVPESCLALSRSLADGVQLGAAAFAPAVAVKSQRPCRHTTSCSSALRASPSPKDPPPCPMGPFAAAGATTSHPHCRRAPSHRGDCAFVATRDFLPNDFRVWNNRQTYDATSATSTTVECESRHSGERRTYHCALSTRLAERCF